MIGSARGRAWIAAALTIGSAALAACVGAKSPHASGGPAPVTLEIGRAASALTGVAGDGAMAFAALSRGVLAATAGGAAAATGGAAATAPARVTAVEAIRPAAGAAPVWRTELGGFGGPIAIAGPRIAVALGGAGTVGRIELRGQPGAVVAALDRQTGAPVWTTAIDSTDWAVIGAIAGIGDDVVVGGSFAGTLRIADRVVSSAGASDGFAARLTATGGVAWLIRVGGPGADAIQGVAAAGDRIAIAGSFATGADLLGEPLTAFDDRSPRADGFVAVLDPTGAKRWVQTFGGKADDLVAGVAIDAAGRIAVAATAQGTVQVGAVELVIRGPGDGVVAWWDAGGTMLNAIRIGGDDFDGLRAIAPAGERVVVAGFYSGALRIGDRALTAGGGDDAFAAELDAAGNVADAWSLGGEGREEVTALAAIPGGFVAGVAHTARASLDGAALAAPGDPMSGAALVIRAVK